VANLIWIMPVALGFAAVVQAGLNNRMIGLWSLTSTVIINNIGLLATSLIVYLLAKSFPSDLPATLRLKEPQLIAWWFIIPGILGYSLVAGIPFLIGKIGVSNVFVGLIGAQLIGSILWDYYFESRSLTLRELLGSIIVMGGTVFTLWPGRDT